MSGILSDPMDSGGRGRRSPTRYQTVEARKGLTVRHRSTGVVGAIAWFGGSHVTLRDRFGREHVLPVADGAFSCEGTTVTLVRPRPGTGSKPKTPTQTASGSIAVAGHRARVARPSRILVEGIHDAELVEKVWGDDLRVEGVVVEPLHGADDLAETIERFQPGHDRRLGILLDHLVADTKEWRLAATIDHRDVLITGHPFVDVWQAIRPSVIGIGEWPTIPRGTDWKTGVCRALGFAGTPGEFWTRLLARVSSYRDLEPGLVGAVEQLIDFVAPPPMD